MEEYILILFCHGGFITENAFKGTFARFNKIPCMILEMEISDEQYLKLEKIIENFESNRKKYSYAVVSLFIADMKFSYTSKNKYFCSQFVSKVLNDINIPTPKAPEHMHPLDFTKIAELKTIYEGDLKAFCNQTKV